MRCVSSSASSGFQSSELSHSGGDYSFEGLVKRYQKEHNNIKLTALQLQIFISTVGNGFWPDLTNKEHYLLAIRVALSGDSTPLKGQIELYPVWSAAENLSRMFHEHSLNQLGTHFYGKVSDSDKNEIVADVKGFLGDLCRFELTSHGQELPETPRQPSKEAETSLVAPSSSAEAETSLGGPSSSAEADTSLGGPSSSEEAGTSLVAPLSSASQKPELPLLAAVHFSADQTVQVAKLRHCLNLANRPVEQYQLFGDQVLSGSVEELQTLVSVLEPEGCSEVVLEKAMRDYLENSYVYLSQWEGRDLLHTLLKVQLLVTAFAQKQQIDRSFFLNKDNFLSALTYCYSGLPSSRSDLKEFLRALEDVLPRIITDFSVLKLAVSAVQHVPGGDAAREIINAVKPFINTLALGADQNALVNLGRALGFSFLFSTDIFTEQAMGQWVPSLDSLVYLLNLIRDFVRNDEVYDITQNLLERLGSAKLQELIPGIDEARRVLPALDSGLWPVLESYLPQLALESLKKEPAVVISRLKHEGRCDNWDEQVAHSLVILGWDVEQFGSDEVTLATQFALFLERTPSENWVQALKAFEPFFRKASLKTQAEWIKSFSPEALKNFFSSFGKLQIEGCVGYFPVTFFCEWVEFRISTENSSEAPKARYMAFHQNIPGSSLLSYYSWGGGSRSDYRKDPEVLVDLFSRIPESEIKKVLGILDDVSFEELEKISPEAEGSHKLEKERYDLVYQCFLNSRKAKLAQAIAERYRQLHPEVERRGWLNWKGSSFSQRFFLYSAQSRPAFDSIMHHAYGKKDGFSFLSPSGKKTADAIDLCRSSWCVASNSIDDRIIEGAKLAQGVVLRKQKPRFEIDPHCGELHFGESSSPGAMTLVLSREGSIRFSQGGKAVILEASREKAFKSALPVSALKKVYTRNGGGVVAACAIFGVFCDNSRQVSLEKLKARQKENPNGASNATLIALRY